MVSEERENKSVETATKEHTIDDRVCGNSNNLIRLKRKDEPYLSEEDRIREHEIKSKGGKARAQQRRERRDMKVLIQDMLNVELSKDQANAIIGEEAIKNIPDGDLSMMAVLLMRTMQEVAQGNHKALETIANLGGYNPKTQVEITADVTTDADRALLENVQKRLNA